ncbi:MAG TPA: hypothetical protein VHS78_18995 [Candidatus Elarobacter sp.]|jgi:hypothetical protein|nr:hypothetical protein [Candidatus Elarobacter sp.]
MASLIGLGRWFVSVLYLLILGCVTAVVQFTFFHDMGLDGNAILALIAVPAVVIWLLTNGGLLRLLRLQDPNNPRPWI